jgi:hypothetical protein
MQVVSAPDVPAGYFHRLGRLTHSWAVIETSMDYAVAIIFHELVASEASYAATRARAALQALELSRPDLAERD